MTEENTSTIRNINLRAVEDLHPIARNTDFKDLIMGRYSNNIVATAYLPDGYSQTDFLERRERAAKSISEQISGWYKVKRKQYEKFLDYSDTFTRQDVDTEDPETIMTTKTNDTPTDEGDYSQDKYTSNVVRTNSVQKRSKVQKYIEARETLVNDIYPKLVQEFYDTFVIEEQEGLF